MKPDHPVYQIGQSGLTSFEQELPALIHFMCEHILVTPLGIEHASSQPDDAPDCHKSRQNRRVQFLKPE
jgi:hypothetical protein